MGADQSKTPKSLSQSIDYLAANYILTSNFQDLQDLSDASSCKELVVLTSDVLDKYMTERDVAFLQQRLEGSVEKNFMTKKSLAYFNEEKLDDMDVKSDLQKKRMCLGIAKFYIRIFHVFNAIAHTVNPEYTWVDANGQSHTVGYEQKGDIPENVKYSLTKMNLCSEKMNALADKTNLDIIIQDDDTKDIEIKPQFCGINLNEENGTANVQDEPGMPELERLYYDQYNYATGKFQSMSQDMKEVYEEDVKILYKAFAHDKKSMPSDITKFSDIQLRDFENIVQCQPNGVFTKAYSGSLKEKQFQEYADNIRLMKQNTKENQDALMKILDSIFAFTPDPQTKGKKMISIHPDLTEKSLDAVVAKTREAILKLYTTCEKDFYKGLQLFEAIVWKQMLDTSVKQIDNLKLDINNEMAAQPEDLPKPGQQPYPGFMGQPNAGPQDGPTAPMPGAPGNYYNNQQNYNIKQEVLQEKKDDGSKSESESESESESDDEKDEKTPYEKVVTPPQQRVNFNPASSPIVPLPRQQYNPNFVDLTRPRPNFVHSIESKEVGIGEQNNNTATLAALTPVKKEPVYDSRPLYNANNTTFTPATVTPAAVTPATVTPEKSVMKKLTSDVTGFFSKVMDDDTNRDDNLKKNVKSPDAFTTPTKSGQMEHQPTTPYVTELEPDIYREEQDGQFCGKHAINQLLGNERLSKEDMGAYCADCSNSTAPVCGDLGENCDISVLIYILATKKEKVGDFNVIVMPEYLEETNVCIHNLENVYFDEKSEHCIMIHLYENMVGCIARINNNHFVTYKKTEDGNYSLIDSMIPEIKIFTPQNMAIELMNKNVSGIIIVKNNDGNKVVTCKKSKENLADVVQRKMHEAREREQREREQRQNEDETAASTPATATTETTQENKRLTDFVTTEGAVNSNAALGTTFNTQGISNENTPSTNTQTDKNDTERDNIQPKKRLFPKFEENDQVIYTKDGQEKDAVIVKVDYNTAPNYAYEIIVDGKDNTKDTIQSMLRFPTDDEIAARNATKIAENARTEAEQEEASEKAGIEEALKRTMRASKEPVPTAPATETEANKTGISLKSIFNSAINTAAGLAATATNYGTATTRAPTNQSSAPEVSAKQTVKPTQNVSKSVTSENKSENISERPGTPILSENESSESDESYESNESSESDESDESSESSESHESSEYSESSESDEEAIDCTPSCLNMEDAESIVKCIQKLENDIEKNSQLIEKNKVVKINDGGRLTKQNQKITKEKAQCKREYNRVTGNKYDEVEGAQKGGMSRRKKKSAKKGSQSRKKKHTKKHRKNSRRKTKSMKRVKKLKK